MTNRFLEHTGAKYPIIQAPMGWIARSQLASAVCAAGGLGIIETSSGETDACKAEIEKMFELTDAPFGVNLPIMFLKDDAMLSYICESGVKFVTTSAGSPSKFIGPLKEAGIIVYHAVPSVEAAIRCVEAGIDGLVVEGGEGGGFKNPEEVSTLVLLQAVRAAVDVPLVAAGGICDGRGMAALLRWRRSRANGYAVCIIGGEPGSRQLQIRHCRCADNGNLRAEQKSQPVHPRPENRTHPQNLR